MTTTETRSSTLTNQIVFTWWPEGSAWYEGVLTGYADDGVFVLQHVIALKPGCLVRMLRAGIAEARDLKFRAIRFAIPDAYPLAKGLSVAARRVGCSIYAEREGWTHWILAL